MLKLWKLLPACLLVACAANEQQAVSTEGQTTQARVVRQVQLPLVAAPPSMIGQPARSTFQGQGTQGWVDVTGAFEVSRDIRHGRLRCATYEAGIQVGRGNPACSGVEWLTDVNYATRMRHCNSAKRLHTGSGRFPGAANQFEGATCVRVVVRCEGTC